MSSSFNRQCLHCGMRVTVAYADYEESLALVCPKCDGRLFRQSDGSVLTRDIAHGGETVVEALAKLDDSLEQAWRGYCRALRVIVGGGLIREEVLGQLHYLT